jgi:hypothetical protein
MVFILGYVVGEGDSAPVAFPLNKDRAIFGFSDSGAGPFMYSVGIFGTFFSVVVVVRWLDAILSRHFLLLPAKKAQAALSSLPWRRKLRKFLRRSGILRSAWAKHCHIVGKPRFPLFGL